jgi:hypothetical protein
MRLPVPVLAALLLLAACDQPPAKEIAAAEAAVRKAREAGADVYVAERYAEAEAALQEARRHVGEKDYRGALSAATDAAEKARAATQAAGAARTLAQSDTETTLAEADAALEEVARLREEARTAKLPDEAFTEPALREEQLRAAIGAAHARLEAGDVLAAQKAAHELKARALELPPAVQSARETWEREHPKKKPRPRRR